MKTFLQIFGGTLIALALMAMAGSAGDCDGKCGPGNDIATMLQIAGMGLALFLTGTIIMIRGQ